MFANKYSNGGLIFCFYLCLQHPCYLGNCDPCRIHKGMPFMEIGKKINCCKRKIITTFTEITEGLRKYICFLRVQGSVEFTLAMVYYIPHKRVWICNSHILKDLNSKLLTIIYVPMTNSEQKELLSPFWNFCILHRITENHKDYYAENRVDPLLALVYQQKEVFFWTVFGPASA